MAATTGIGERRFDLRPVADDGRIGQQAIDRGVAEARDGIRVESGEGGSEGLALGEDRPPRQPGLEGLQAEPLVQAAVIADGPAPFGVVIRPVVLGPQRGPRAAQPSVRPGGGTVLAHGRPLPSWLQVHVSGNGVLEKVGPEGGYGKYIRIKHANGYETGYGHMSAVSARVGDRIAMLYEGKIRQVGTVAQIQQTEDPVVRQFIEGRPE